jgi:hypothetical protein
MSIKLIIEKAIGEDKQPSLEGIVYNPIDADPACVAGYNQALADLRNKIPEIEKKIIEEIEKIKGGIRVKIGTSEFAIKESEMTLKEIELFNAFSEGYNTKRVEVGEIIKNLTS